MHIVHVVGARPNFMKVAPVHAALAARGTRQMLVHTGQHYDANMSDVFFSELGIPAPDVNLGVGSGSHAQQTAAIMSRFEHVVLKAKPDMVVVYGDVNSTMAATLVSAKLHVPVAHVEAGLRSFDQEMPEEINRRVTDVLAGLLFTPSEDANLHLESEGVPANRVHFVGNVMIDTLSRVIDRACTRFDELRKRFSLQDYILVTLHRPSNVDDPGQLHRILSALNESSRELPALFPIHPRTRQRLGSELGNHPAIQFIEPLGYVEFLALQRFATAVVTDSGGIQEETTWLGVPCLTLRENTERPVTITVGTNVLIGRDMERLRAELRKIIAGKAKVGDVPPLWDGKASERIADVLTCGERAATVSENTRICPWANA